ncbi:MAG TPA: 4Fe-4S dicluster domain-containing protein [bacterium]|nr:4Fe-4S dicluster domain-containing protein [bacterium]HNJ71074.1 4Fe-4S dicluster domain-containing protein [bacterium]
MSHCQCQHTPDPRREGLRDLLAENVLSDWLKRDTEWDYLRATPSLENVMRWSQYRDDHTSVRPDPKATAADHVLEQSMDRRSALQNMAAAFVAGLGLLQTACNPLAPAEDREKAQLAWDDYFQGNFRMMSDAEKREAVSRLERMYEMHTGKHAHISDQGPIPGVLYGYAFNISKCRGYLECIRGCIKENNQDRRSGMQYITVHEHKKGRMDFSDAPDNFYHEVPMDGHFYIGTQCMHCENPPCVDVCPVQATWKEQDGIVVVDYNWCIGCRYCAAACPYDARRFNWQDPVVPENEVNLNQHYLGNRLRKKGVMEKCTFCIQRTRNGKNPACVEACPTGARIFGNLLDPSSEIRWVLANKKVFRLKEDLGTEPKFWYFMD